MYEHAHVDPAVAVGAGEGLVLEREGVDHRVHVSGGLAIPGLGLPHLPLLVVGCVHNVHMVQGLVLLHGEGKGEGKEEGRRGEGTGEERERERGGEGRRGRDRRKLIDTKKVLFLSIDFPLRGTYVHTYQPLWPEGGRQ